MISVLTNTDQAGGSMGTDLDAFAIAAYVRIDDFLKDRPDLAQPRPTTGITPKLSDAELLTLAIIQA